MLTDRMRGSRSPVKGAVWSEVGMIAVVTGAGRGLGRAFAEALVARGDTVFGTVRRPTPELEDAGIVPLMLDVAEPASIAAFVGALASRTDRVDLLVHNAGINSRGVPEGQRNVRYGALEPAGILRMVQVNAIAPLLVTQALDGHLNDGSKVLAVGSWLGSVATKTSGGNHGYCVSKAALNMAMRALAFDLVERGIVCAVANPGWVSTDMGGPKAGRTPAQAAADLLAIAERMTTADAGRFFHWDGTDHPW